jgi:HD-GYP domain-containing protein (c-di-GMP phosphodiesterase class II)
VGKIGVPDAILVKPGSLTAREWNAMRRHAELGARLLEPLASLADVALWVRHHHEWFDGSGQGYPDRLMGEQIPLPSRILAVADALDALTTRHPYRRERSLAEALDELRALSGRRFDPDVVEAAARLASRSAGRRSGPTLRAVRERP